MPPHLSADQTDGDLILRVGREGRASLLGHDLTFRVGSWAGQTTIDGASALGTVRVVALLPSLEVLHATGGLAPLTARERLSILQNALVTLRARTHPEVVFEAVDVPVLPGPSRVEGRVSVAGTTRPQVVDVVVERADARMRVRASAALKQSDFGISPYSSLLGALRVRDLVQVDADFTVDAWPAAAG